MTRCVLCDSTATAVYIVTAAFGASQEGHVQRQVLEAQVQELINNMEGAEKRLAEMSTSHQV